MTQIRVDDESMKSAVNRLKRAHGQLGGVLRMIDEGKDCEAVITQLAAVSKAINKAGFAIIASGMRQCLDNEEPADIATMEKLLLTLA